MLGVYLDTSALAKLYHTEIGTLKTEQLVLDSAGSCFVWRLGVLEMRSVPARKTRTGEISPAASAAVLQRFRGDIRRRRFRVVPLGVRHYELAERLVDVYGLAAAKTLCRVAPLGRLPAINPEAATP